MEEKHIIILIILLFVIAFIVSIAFPLSTQISIPTNMNCKSFSFDIKQNLEDSKNNVILCEEICLDRNLEYSSLTCHKSKVFCACKE